MEILVIDDVEILDEYRACMHNPKTGVMFHNGNRECLDTDKLAQRVIRPAVGAIGLPWYGWHGTSRNSIQSVRLGCKR